MPFAHLLHAFERTAALMHEALARSVGIRSACLHDQDQTSSSAEPSSSVQQERSNLLSCNKGPCVKMSSWTSLLEAIAHYAPNWDRWEQLMTVLRANMLSATDGNANLWPHAEHQTIMDLEPVAGGLPVDVQEAPGHGFARAKISSPMGSARDDNAQAETSTDNPHMTDAASAARTMALAPSLFTAGNFVSVQVLLMVKRALVSRQSKLASGRTGVKHQQDAIMSREQRMSLLSRLRWLWCCITVPCCPYLSTCCWARLELAAALAGEDDQCFLASPAPLLKFLAHRAKHHRSD